MFALLAVWIAVGALLTTLVAVFSGWHGQEAVVTLLPYTYAVSVTLAAAVLWAHRRKPRGEPGVAGQRMQAFTAIVLNSLSLSVLLVTINGVLGGMAGLAVEAAFLWLCWLGYARIVLRER